jgi:large subunit ribosomal protein L3
VYDGDNALVPVTVVEASLPGCEVKTVETDGYNAVQLGFGPQTSSASSRPKSSMPRRQESPLRRLSEFPSVRSQAKAGDVVTVEIFKEGQSST